MIDNPLKTHVWTSNEPREIKIEGKSIFHHHCRKCGRDFARELGQAAWKAVYIGPFSAKFLDDSVGQQWVSEPCLETLPPMATMPSKDARGSASSVKVRHTKRPRTPLR